MIRIAPFGRVLAVAAAASLALAACSGGGEDAAAAGDGCVRRAGILRAAPRRRATAL